MSKITNKYARGSSGNNQFTKEDRAAVIALLNKYPSLFTTIAKFDMRIRVLGLPCSIESTADIIAAEILTREMRKESERLRNILLSHAKETSASRQCIEFTLSNMVDYMYGQRHRYIQ